MSQFTTEQKAVLIKVTAFGFLLLYISNRFYIFAFRIFYFLKNLLCFTIPFALQKLRTNIEYRVAKHISVIFGFF